MGVSVVEVPTKAVTTDLRVDWTVEITTYIPELASNDIGLQMTVISLDGDEKEFELKATKPPVPVTRVRDDAEKLPGRLDTFNVQLPKDFVPAAVRVLDM
jgi:hypothetical protein